MKSVGSLVIYQSVHAPVIQIVDSPMIRTKTGLDSQPERTQRTAPSLDCRTKVVVCKQRCQAGADDPRDLRQCCTCSQASLDFLPESGYWCLEQAFYIRDNIDIRYCPQVPA